MKKVPSGARFAWATLCFNVAVVLWGAFVRATGSGAGCGNKWPVCSGSLLETSANANGYRIHTPDDERRGATHGCYPPGLVLARNVERPLGTLLVGVGYCVSWK